MKKIKLVVSKCLLGYKVRYNGTHKEDIIVKKLFTKYFQLTPVCPEVECGLSIPREPMILIKKGNKVVLVSKENGTDYTKIMQKWISSKIEEIKDIPVSGFILKSKSPSCGLCVNLFDKKQNCIGKSPGIWAKACIDVFNEKPKIEEKDLYNFYLRENFLCSVFVISKWEEIRNTKEFNQLKNFHNKHKIFLKTKSKNLFKKLEAITDIKDENEFLLFNRYEKILLNILTKKMDKFFFLNLLKETNRFLEHKCANRLYELYIKEKISEVSMLEILRYYLMHTEVKDQFYIKPVSFEYDLKYVNLKE